MLTGRRKNKAMLCFRPCPKMRLNLAEDVKTRWWTVHTCYSCYENMVPFPLAWLDRLGIKEDDMPRLFLEGSNKTSSKQSASKFPLLGD